MDEEIVATGIYEYGSDVVNGVPEGQKIKWTDATTSSGIHVLEEYGSIGCQNLKIEDIIEALNKIPLNIRKYISVIVLAPFYHPLQDYFNKRMGREGNAFASGDWSNRQITIYAIPKERSILRETLSDHMTLSHEAGHIIDGNIQQNMEFFAYTPRWTKAMCEDTKVEHITPDLPYYFVSPNAEDLKSLREDFADSVMYFSSGIYNTFLKTDFPNRYKILEELINGR
jgi:hypothetical protein